MNLKTATLIAIVCISISTILSLILPLLYGYSRFSHPSNLPFIQLLLFNGGILIFLIVLYTKQKK